MQFSHRVAAGDRLLGTFVKTPHHAVIEALAGGGLDFVILDAEHAPFGLAEVDRCLLAARAGGLPALVRLTEARPADILRVLDLGADGFLAPHVTTAAQARGILAAARYGAGGRGYSATTRAGRYGRIGMAEHLAASTEVFVVLQIEDPEGVEAVEEIAALPGIGALFVGRADLAAAYGATSLDAPEVGAAYDRVAAACAEARIPLATFVPSMADAPAWFDRRAQLVAVASEHAAMQTFFSPGAVAEAKRPQGCDAAP